MQCTSHKSSQQFSPSLSANASSASGHAYTIQHQAGRQARQGRNIRPDASSHAVNLPTNQAVTARLSQGARLPAGPVFQDSFFLSLSLFQFMPKCRPTDPASETRPQATPDPLRTSLLAHRAPVLELALEGFKIHSKKRNDRKKRRKEQNQGTWQQAESD